MAINRYDQRKNYEEAEANAIGTEYVRADLLPAADAAKVSALLRKYLDQRILFYRTPISTSFADQCQYCSTAERVVVRGPGPGRCAADASSRLAVAGMNDVLNSQGYTQAAWWNRIPLAAWGLMVAIAICCNLLIGYGARRPKPEVAPVFCFAAGRVHFVLSHSGH